MIGYIYKFENKINGKIYIGISRVCKNERKSCGGFIWRYY